MGLFIYPRGGSARVTGYLSRALGAVGWPVTLACGSLGETGALGNAESVFAGVDIVSARYDDAVARWARGEDPMDAPLPMDPSFEARLGGAGSCFPLGIARAGRTNGGGMGSPARAVPVTLPRRGRYQPPTQLTAMSLRVERPRSCVAAGLLRWRG